MKTLSQHAVIGIDVSRDGLDFYCLPEGRSDRQPNTETGHKKLARLAKAQGAMVCFEATGGHEWNLWAYLDAEGIATRQLPPAQVRAFATSCGTRAKTDRIDAELIARFMLFRPDAGRQLPHEKLRHLRALTTKRAQMVETRKRHTVQAKAHKKQGTAALFVDLDNAMNKLFDQQIAELEKRIKNLIADDETLSKTADILRSVPAFGFVSCSMLIAEMPELGSLNNSQIAALAGLAPIAQDSGIHRGKRRVGGGRRKLRNVLYQAALVASHHNPHLKAFAERLHNKGKPHKVIITAIARKLIVLANALCKSRQKWQKQHS